MVGASFVFFAFIGFDSISTHAEEARHPQRDVPIGILVSLVLCTLLYIAVAAVITGMVPYPDINIHAPIAAAFTERAEAEKSIALAYFGRNNRRRRIGWHDQRAIGAVFKPGTNIYGHGPGWTIAPDIRPRTSSLPHASHCHHRDRCHNLFGSRLDADSKTGRNGEHRHAHGFCHGVCRRYDSSCTKASSTSPFPMSGAFSYCTNRDRGKSQLDAFPASRHLAAI